MKNTFSDCEKQPAPNGGGGGGSGGDNGDAGGGGVGVGLKCLVTAGPTREFFDPVRYISNPSSGKMGYAIAAAAADVGCAVSLVSGPVALAAPTGVALRNVITGAEMLAATGELFGECDILIMAAAVCDFRPKHRALAKVKKENVPLSADFESVPDILKTLSARKRVGQTLVGFA
ncbi:MAG: phosphopantothenoylcysteine decarboxylase, partial [Puniceicoccales bacterium]|nr:phosphopantothenoylcysteine decarboxylase [Puniceicoccales bacterium]